MTSEIERAEMGKERRAMHCHATSSMAKPEPEMLTVSNTNVAANV